MPDLLRCALAPQSVAVIGASNDIHKIGGRPLYYMQRHGYRGRAYPIHPSGQPIQGHASYARLADLPEVPELALIAVGGDKAIAAVQDCADAGVQAAIVIASGFGETGPEGLAVQQALVARARAAGMRLFGPNTQGLANFGSGTIAGFSTMFIEVPPQDGPIAVISQSGGMASMVYGMLRGRGLGVRHVHATGNEADVSASELAWAVAHDPEVRLLLLYLENIAQPDILAQTAAYARERDLPIVVVKAGRSARGQQAASSHTGALANEDRTVDAFLRHHGLWRVRDPHALALAAEAYLQGWRPTGRRLVVLSNSGASCVLGADLAEELQLPLADLAPATQAAIAAKLPGFATVNNPIDVTAALLSNSGLFGDVLPAVAQDPAADLFFLNIPVAGAGYDVDRFARDAAAFAATTGKPVAVAAWQANVAAPFRAQGIPTYANEAEALGTLAQLAGHTALLRRPRAAWPEASALPAPDLSAGGAGLWNEADSLALLGRHGVPVVPLRLCRSANEARAAFEALGGGPVVAKACSAEVPHKSEHGLVALNVASADAAADYFERFWARMAAMGVRRDGVLIAPMRKGRHEFMVGAHQDPVFGPVVVVGDGGKQVEALNDVAVLLPPFDAAEVEQALRGLRIAPLLDGVRGDPPLDLPALAQITVAVGQLMVASQGRLASLDLNPVLVGARGEGAVVVDTLVERAE